MKDLGQLLPRLGVVRGAGVDPDGSVLVVLDAAGLIDRAWQSRPAPAAPPPDSASPEPPPQGGGILVVDDALTVRELQRSILERAGYRVRLASDGAEALATLIGEPADLVLTDVEMPRLDGFGLTEAIRSHPALANIAVLILSSRASDEDRLRGIALFAIGQERGAAIPLAHFCPIAVQDERDVSIARGGRFESAKERHVLRGIGEVVFTANHMSHLHLEIVHDVAEMENGLAVRANDDKIRIEPFPVGQFARHISDHQVRNDHRLPGHPEFYGAFMKVGAVFS